jgi:hypothetical protein
MLEALIGDFQQLEGCRIATVWDASLGTAPFHDVKVHTLARGNHEAALRAALDEADAALIVAPESGGDLERYTRMAEAAGVRCLGAPSPAVTFCADKLAVAQTLASAGLPTIETRLCGLDARPAPLEFPFVVKPRFGAGCLDTWFVDSPETWDRLCTLLDNRPMSRAVVQPFVPGRALSVSLILDGAGNRFVLPVAQQRIGHERCLDYLGGRISTCIAEEVASVVQDAALAACRVCPDLRGYVGVDLILPARGTPVVVEINPRVTTSYVGYRVALDENLATALLVEQLPGTKRIPAVRSVSYATDGTIELAANRFGRSHLAPHRSREGTPLLKMTQ